jgi:hypothetical protein
MVSRRANVALYGGCGSGKLRMSERLFWPRRAEVALEGL